MATKKEIETALKEQYGLTMSRNDVKQFLGLSGNGTVDAFLCGVEAFTLNKGGHKRYYIGDIAKAYIWRQKSS